MTSVFIFAYLNLPHYQRSLSDATQYFLQNSWVPAVFAIAAFQVCRFVLGFDKETKAIILYEFFADVLAVLRRKKKKITFDPKVRTAILSYIVKFFFFPIMLSTVIVNGGNLFYLVQRIISGNFVLDFKTFYDNSRTLIFFFDTLIFAFGYAVESELFNSKIKSVEPTFLGWAVALCTYPPFNGYTSRLIPLSQGGADIFHEGVWFLLPLGQDFLMKHFTVIHWITIIVRVIILVLYGIYVWATFALGAKASNLTNRGIIAKGPYKFVRHPAYVSKNLAWWLEGVIAATSPIYFISMIGWNLIYILRALTEERHLRADPEYLEYMKKVKWKFVPGVV